MDQKSVTTDLEQDKTQYKKTKQNENRSNVSTTCIYYAVTAENTAHLVEAAPQVTL